MTTSTVARVLLVGGHESAEGAELARLETVVEGGIALRPGRSLHNAVSTILAQQESVVVVPMTFGRNPTMVADAAKTLKWLAAKHPGRIALAPSFGQHDHLMAWLRAAANKAKEIDPEAALLIVAPPSNPFDEAELHRIAYLVGTHGALSEVAVAIADDPVMLGPFVDRLRRLGATRIAAVPAGFEASLPDSGAQFLGPLMSDPAIARVIRARVTEALNSLRAGYDGIDEGLMADHGHGYAHSHAFEESQGHGVSHSHGHAHGHSHSHRHGHSHSQHHPGPLIPATTQAEN